MKRVNLKFLAILLVTLLVGVFGAYFLRRFQVSRNASGLVKRAKQLIDEDKPAEAIPLYARYLGLKPEDDEAYAEFAELMLERANAPDATRPDIARAYNTLEAAVRKRPDDDRLRRKLAEFQLRVGRAGDAKEHIMVLAERVAKNPPTPGAEPAETGPASEPKTGDADPDEDVLDESDVQLLLARSLLASGDVEEALRAAGTPIGFDFDSRSFTGDEAATATPDAYIIVAAILDEKFKDTENAKNVLDKLIERHATDAQAWLALSAWHRQRGEIDKAETAVQKGLEIAPDEVNTLFAAFEVALARRDLEQAESICRKARELFPADERGHRGLASLALQKNDPATAEEILLEGIELLPDKASLLLMLADTKLQQNKLEETEQVIDRLKELYGSSGPGVILLEGRLLLAQRRWSEAKQALERVRPLAVGMPDLLRQVDLYLAQCHAQLNEYDAQLEVNRRVLSSDPGSLAARAGAAAALQAAGKWKEALAEFEAIATALPEDRLMQLPQLWYPLLQLRIQEQASREAVNRDWDKVDALVELLQQSPALTPGQIGMLRADVLVRKGEADTAREILEKAAADGNDPRVWSALLTLQLRQDGAATAAQALAPLSAEVVESLPVMLVTAAIASQLPREEASRMLEAVEGRIAKLAPPEAMEVLAATAGSWGQIGDRAACERVWKQLLDRSPEDVRARDALLELALADGDVSKAQAIADEIAEVTGRASARAKVAQAGILIADVRSSLQSRAAADGSVGEPSAEEQAKLDEARNLLMDAESERPGWAQVQAMLSDIEGFKGNIPATIERLQKALANGPLNPVLGRRLVSLLYSSNRLEEAQAALEQLGGDSQEGIQRITAEMRLRAGKPAEAAALAEKAVGDDTQNVADLLWLAQMLEKSGQAERAAAVLSRAAELEPDRPEPWLSLFSVQIATGDRAGAERSLERGAAKLDEPKRQLALGQGYEQLGRPADAERSFRDALTAAPDNFDARRGLAAFLTRAGRFDDATEALRGIIQTTDASATASDARSWARRMLVEITAQRGRHPEFQEALNLLRENADATGQLSADDLVLQVTLLSNRPEPISWRMAIKVLEELRSRQELTVAQRILLAELHEKTGNWDECRNELVSVVAGPQAPPAYIAMLTEKMIDRGEVSAARPWLARLRKEVPDSAITLALEAKLAIAENDRQAAADAARRLMPGGGVAGEQPAQLGAIAALMEQLGFAKAADRVFQQYAEATADGALARAEFLGRQKRATEALDLLDELWDKVPLEKLLTAAVQVVRSQDDPAESADRVRAWTAKAARIDPGSIVVSILDADLRALGGRPDEAEKIYRDLLERGDLDAMQNAIIANNLAFHLAKPDTAAEAEALIDKSIAELGPLPDLLDTRGMIRLAKGDHQAALEDLREAVLQPTFLKFLHLAAAQFKAGDPEAAKRSLEAGRLRGLSKAKLAPDERQRLAELQTALGIEEAASADEPRG